MSVKDLCPNCVHSETCQTVYRRLGNQSGPSVAAGAFAAFLLPLLVFIVVLAVSQKILPNFLNNETYQILVALLLAVSISFVAVLLIRGLFHPENEGNTVCKLKGE
jgi:Mn2+/Fe2+ NRAMP family transporter